MTGKKIIDSILMGTMILASLAALGVFVYTQILYEKPLPDNQLQTEKLIKDSKNINFPDAYKLDKLTINLESDSSRLRFLDVQVFLVPFESSQTSLFEEHKAVIQDLVIDVTDSMTPSELNSVSGKILLESKIKKAINGNLGGKIVKKIYFSRFVIQ